MPCAQKRTVHVTKNKAWMFAQITRKHFPIKMLQILRVMLYKQYFEQNI